MRRFLTLIVLFLASHYAFSQTEICNNGLDDDFDGFIDCYDGSCANSPLCDGLFLGNDAACEAVPPAFPQFTMSLDFSSPNETTNHLSRLAIGDLDRDGIPEMVTMNRYTNKIFILNGNNGSVKVQKTVTWEPYWEIAIANIDNDNCGEIYFIGQQDPPGNNNSGVYIFAYDCQLNKLWETAQKLPGDPINFGLADFDGDGKVELYAKDEIYDAKTGVRIVKSTASNYSRFNGGPVAANIVGDDKLELIAGLNIYQVNLGARTLDAGSLTLLQNRSEYFTRFEYNATSIADYNLDGFLDVLASGSTISNGKNTTVFFWDVKNNAIKTYADFQPALGTNYEFGWVNGTGRLNIADLDGNGKMNASYVSGRFLYALDENFNLLWRVNINEETSGHTGCTLFDFNGDGKAEIVYRDERFIYIIEGTDGSVYSQQACISRTNREYPIVADVDADGSTELCVPCGFNDANSSTNFNDLNYSRYSHIRVFKSAAEPWVPARRVWNQHGYFVVNVNDDLTIPKKLQPHQLVFSTGNCTQGPNRPLNKFLNQSPYLNSEGCPTYAAPDIAFHVAPTIIPPTCPNLNFQVSFKITNLGDVAVTGNIPVSFYSSDPMQAGATKLATINIPVNALSTGDIVSVDNQTVTGIGSQFVYVVLNDAGTSVPTPIVLPNTNFIECDYDNIRFAQIIPLPVAITGVPVSASETCTSTANGVARAFIPISGGGENTADYNFYWSNGTVAKPIASADFIGPVYSGLAPGSYTVFARHKTANCNSNATTVVIGTTTAPFPPITINVLSDQTTCAPFNGKLEAVIQGGGAGYTIDWYDIALNSLGISGPIANNLQAGSYLAVISKGTCNTSVPATVNPPTVPDAQASTLQDVVDCTNPNSGSITADALVSGVVQNAANYSFTWYRYDNTNHTRGSILPAAHGTGKTRTGLPVGFYQVEVKENASQCPSTITPIVEVKSNLSIPDAPHITIVAQQTSCDPLHPNGVMTADVTVGGVAQNPANFTFEWFKGQNTLAVNKVTTVSDVNGKTVNQVAGGGTPYTVRVTNAFNCSSVADLPVTENIKNPVVTLAQLTPNTICDPAKTSPAAAYNGSLRATVTFDGNNITLPDNNYTFTWRNPANAVIAVADNKNPVLSGLQDGNSYSVTVRRNDLACVSAPDTEPVTKTTVIPALSTTATGSNTCDPLLTPDGTATVSITNSVPADAFTFRWHSGNAVVPANVLPAANNFNQATAIKLGGVAGSPNPYTVLVTNTRTGCENTATQFVSDESVIPVLAFGLIKPNSICAPATAFNGEMNAVVTNIPAGYTIADYSFRWFDGQMSTTTLHSPASTTTKLTGLDALFYTVDATNTKTGCKSTAISDQVPNAKIFPALLPASTGSNNCDPSLTPDGTVSFSVTNIQPGDVFAQQWYNGSAVTAGQELPAGNNGTSITANKLGGPVGAPKPYTVLVTNTTTGCTNFTTASVPDVSVVPVLSTAVVANSICAPSTNFSGSFTANVTNIPVLYTIADYDFTFRNAANTIVQASSPDNSLNNVDAGAYNVVGRNRLTGCQSAPANNNVPNTKVFPDLTPSSTGSTNCIVDVVNGIVNNGTATVAVGVTAGPHTFQWYTGTGDPIANALPTLGAGHAETSATATFLGGPVGAPNAYTVLVTDVPSGCTSFTTTSVADLSVIPVLALGPITPNTICTPSTSFDGSITTSVTNMGSFVLTDFAFTWFDGNTTATPHAPQPAAAIDHQLTLLDVASYTVRGYNSRTGCTSAPITGQVPNGKINPVISITTTGSHNCTTAVDSDGTATATVTNNGLGDPMSFAWNAVAPTTAINNGTNNANLATAIKLGGPVNAPNTYNVLVTNTRTGCFNNSQALVADISAKPVPVLTAFDNHVCNPALISPGAQQFDGHVDVTGVNHNGAPYLGTDLTYEWFNVNAMTNVVGASTGVTTVSLPNQNAGKYAVRVRMTGLDCTSDFVIDQVVNDLDAPVITPAVSANTNCPGGGVNANGSAAVTFVDGNAVPSTYTYQWYNGSIVDPGQLRAGDTNPLLGNQFTGPQTFTAEVTNRITGCANSEAMTVTDVRVTPSINVTLVANNTNCSGTPNGALLATPASVGAGFTITWNTPVTIVGNQNTQLPAGAYTATVRDNVTGCVSPADGESIIDVFTFPTVAIAVQPQSTCSGTPNGRLTATDNLSSTFTWFDGPGLVGIHAQTAPNSGIINQLPAASFTVEAVAAGTGCTTIKTEAVPTAIVYPDVTFAGVSQVTRCDTPNGSATATINNLSSPTNYDIFYQFTSTSSGLAFPTSPAVIKASGDPRNALNVNAAQAPYGNLAPGYVTALVIDKNTLCESSPNTQQILDGTTKSNIALALTPAPGTCLAGGGGMTPTVTPLGNAAYTYEWHFGSPNNIGPINFFNNQPTFATGQIYGDGRQNLGAPGGDMTINAGTYTLVVRDAVGCGAYKTDNVPTTSLPVIVISPTDVTRCDSPNGRVSVNITGGGSATGYSIEIFAGLDNTGTSLASGPIQAINIPVATTATLPEGPYYVEVIDGDAPACPLGEIQPLEKLVLAPVITVGAIAPNSSCDPNAVADGKVSLTVTNASGDIMAKDYEVFSITPPVTGFATPTQIGTGASGQSIGPISGFEPVSTQSSYTIKVQDDLSKCNTDLVVSIPDQQNIPSNLNIALTPETACAPLTNGAAVASLAGGESTAIFDFDWYNDNAGTTSVVGGPLAGNGAGTAGELINDARVPMAANWFVNTAGLGSGNRTYYVQGVKNGTAPSGFGCKTALVQVIIPDQHISPNITLTPTFDSFCLSTSANGLIGDGQISIAADSDPGTGGQQNAAGGFNYSWTTPNAALGSPQNGQSNNFTIPQLGDGTYTITAVNATNQCLVTNSVTVVPAPYVLTIEANSKLDQRICNNDGEIRVTQIDLTDTRVGNPNSQSHSNAAIDPLYSFQWYNNASLTGGTELQDAITPAPIVTRFLSHDANGNLVVENGDYGAMIAGSYYVVATRTNPALPSFGCPTLPYRVDVQDVHVNPIPDLLVFSNTSCLPAGPGEGEIHIRVTDNTVTPFNTGTFTYNWDVTRPTPPAAPIPAFPNANPGAGNGDGLGNDDQYVQLMDNASLGAIGLNPYTVLITNTVTGCATNAFATIIKNATPVFVQNATVTDEILCSPTGDGSITVTRVTLNDRTGATQEFVTAPAGPQGNISDFNFTWTRVGNPFVGQTTTGTLLDKTIYDASGAGFNTPIGAGTYTVTARRNTGTPGAGCPSAPFQVIIKDMKIAPVVSLTPFANTSCATLAPAMEGAIAVNVTDATSAPGTTGFTYNWTTTPVLTPIGPGAGDGDGLGTDGDSDNPTILADGGYSVTVTSDRSGCQGIGTTTILKNTSPIFVQDVTVLNQILCGPDGQLTVASVSLKDRSGNTITFPPNINDFQFTWSRTGIAGSQVTAGTVLNSGNYVPANFAGNAIGFGEYSVVARRNTNGPGNGCSSAPYTVSILDRRIFPVVTMTPFANTSCSLNPALFEGEIDITVTDASPAVGPAGFDYTWNAGTGTALVSNNPANDGDGSGTDGDDDNPTTLREGTYNITVISNKSACSTTAQTEIFKNSTPVFTQMVTPTDQIRCVPDGALAVNEVRVIDRNQVVQSSNTDFPISDFQFTYSRGAVPVPAVTGTTLNVGNFPTIGADTYFVTARRVAGGPGLDCVSPPYKVDIQNKALFPVVSLTPFANTACDPLFSEGSIEVRVSDATTVPGPHTFSYTWSGGNPTPIAPSAANNGDGIATGDNDVPTGLFHGTYDVTVRNNQSQCVSTGSTEIFRNSTPIIIPQATTTPQVLCSADGSITVSRVEVTDRNNNTFAAPFADFEFDWSHTTLTPVVATTIGANPGGTTLNNVNYTLIERGQYFVVARRIAGNLGRGCVSAPFHATIDDLRVFPELTFTQEANSSCTNLSPNGEIVANAREINGTNTGPYTFTWALNAGPVSPASVQTNTANASTLANALDGDYLVTATNTITSCPVTSPVTLVLDQSLSTPNIIEVTTVDPLDCNPTGQASVTRITLGSTTNSILFPPNIPPDNEVSGAGLNAFDYEWFQGSVAAGNQLPIGGPVFTTTPTITSLLTGTYFVVVRDPSTDCRSGARQVVITPDDIILPDLLVSQTALQISCRPGIGSAELSVTADGFDDTNPNYTFTWFANDTATPPSIGNASTLSDRTEGTYSVTVHDNTTNCSISDSFIIEDDTQEFTPVVSMASQPRTLCVGTDGEIFARVLNLSPLYPYTPYTSATFTADLYFGANPNLSAAPNMPAIPNTVGFIGNFSQNNLDVGFYTVRITDNNTGCFSVATEELKDARLFPLVDIEEIAPVTNCDPVRPNGVARVTANNTFSGFTFDWYEGTAATGTPVYSGAEFGELKVKPQQYTVRATNVVSGCFTDKTTDIEDGTVPIPAATIEVLSNVTSCVLDNGALTAYVGTDKTTASYIFHWYDGTVENPPADAIGENYNDRPIGNYSVTATSIVTGCKSPLVTAEIITEQEFPNFDFVIQNSTCDQQDGFASMILLTEAPLEKIEWFELSPEPSNGPIMEGPNMTDAGAGVYEIVATTFLGCSTTKQIEIKPDIRPYNGISRNNDGRNDIFQIDCIQNFPSNVVRVFNRAGTLVYEGESYDNSNTVFDGKSNKGISPMGVNLPDGTYYYIVDKRDGTKPIAGYLEIVQ